MRHISHLSPTDLRNHFVKAQESRQAVLRLIANLGIVTLDDVTRVFSPMNEAWHVKVASLTSGYLSWLYHHDERALSQFKPSTATLDLLGPPPELPPSYAKKLKSQGTPRKLLRTEKDALVHFQTARSMAKTYRKEPPDGAVLEVHWLRARAVACFFVDNSGILRARRMIQKLLKSGAIACRRAPKVGYLYALTKQGADELGEAYSPTLDRSWNRSLHRELATGYLLCAASSTSTSEGWSEASLHAEKKAPSIHGASGLFSHKTLHTSLKWNTSHSVHPSDAVVLHLQEELAGDKFWNIELVEAERGNKPAEEFERSLNPLRAGRNKDLIVDVTLKDPVGGDEKHYLTLDKITFVMHSEEFLTPLLTACMQFITGKKEGKNGTIESTGRLTFIGSAESDKPDPRERLAAKWEELLGMVDVAICAISPVNEAFMGVARKVNLMSVAKERGVKPQLVDTKMYEDVR